MNAIKNCKFSKNEYVTIKNGFYKGFNSKVIEIKEENKEIFYKLECKNNHEVEEQWFNEDMLEKKKKTLFLSNKI